MNNSPQPLPSSIKSISDLIEYNWARGNYRACTQLGYEEQCEIGEAAFKNLPRLTAAKMYVNPSERKKAISDINSIPLEIAYAKLQNLFSMRDYRASAEVAEQLIEGFNKNEHYWENIRIPKSRLYADAAVSWLHYADSLSPDLSAKESNKRSIYLKKALVNAQNALWSDFRQQHIPIIEKKLVQCIY